MGRVADTSFLYTAFDQADPRHEEAQAELAKPQVLNVPLCVMAEFLDLVAYRKGRKTALQAHRDLEKLPTFALVGLRDEAGAISIWRQHPGISLVDASAIRACIEGKDRLLSFDVVQAKALAAIRNSDR